MKTFDDRHESTRLVIHQTRKWSAKTAGKLADVLRPYLAEGEEMPDLVLLQELFARALEHHGHRAEEAHQTHCQTTQERHRAIQNRQAKTKELGRRIVDLRRVVRGFVGTDNAIRFFGFGGETSRDPVVLGRQATMVVKALRDPSRRLDLKSYQSFDRSGWAAAIEDAARELETATREATVQAKRLDGATLERQQILKAFNETFVRVAGWLEATYLVADLDRLAEAVKPSRQRPGRLLEEVRHTTRRRALKRARQTAREDAVARQTDVSSGPLCQVAGSLKVHGPQATKELVGGGTGQREGSAAGLTMQWTVGV